MKKTILTTLGSFLLSTSLLTADTMPASIQKGQFSFSGFAGMALTKSKSQYDIYTKGNYTHSTQTAPGVFHTTKESFFQTNKLRSKNASFRPSLEASYGVMENWEILAKFTYFKIDGKKQTYDRINLLNGAWIHPKFASKDVNVFGTYLGTRYYFQAHNYFRPFIGVAIGGLWAKYKNSLSLSVDAGFEVPVSENVSFITKIETSSGRLRQKIKNKTTSSGKVDFKQDFSRNRGKIGGLPLSLGIKVKL
ncbi:MAG: hypothetical protein Q8S31_03555 [Alphaproteobacteria bacterium]|nr:hypothetical protein [Alphaproteobacteria bacterium]